MYNVRIFTLILFFKLFVFPLPSFCLLFDVSISSVNHPEIIVLLVFSSYFVVTWQHLRFFHGTGIVSVLADC